MHFTLRRNNALCTQKKQRTFHSEERANFPLRINNALYIQKKQRTFHSEEKRILHSEELTHFTL